MTIKLEILSYRCSYIMAALVFIEEYVILNIYSGGEFILFEDVGFRGIESLRGILNLE